MGLLKHNAGLYQVQVLAFALMTNHVHLVLLPERAEECHWSSAATQLGAADPWKLLALDDGGGVGPKRNGAIYCGTIWRRKGSRSGKRPMAAARSALQNFWRVWRPT
jgi:hypothetical protein